jgi:hypothetical protein
MRICAVGLMMADFKPYIDFWDWTLPTVYDFFKMPCVFRLWLEKCGLFLPLNNFISVFIWLLTLLSVLCTALIFKKASAKQQLDQGAQSGLSAGELKLIAVPFVTSIALASLIVRFDFGDLQHLMALAIFPWLLLRWLSCRGVYLGHWISLIVGAVAGVAACFDVPFILVFVALELYFVLQERSLKVLMRPEILGFVLAVCVCLVRMSQIQEPASTAFWKWTMGLRMLNYEIFDEALFAAAASPDRRDVCYTIALTLVLAFIFKKKSTIIFPLIILLVCGFGIFILEGQGYSHDLVLCIFSCTAILSILIIALFSDFATRMFSIKERISFARVRYPLILAVALAATLAFGFSLERDRDRLKDYQADQAKGGMEDTLTAIDKHSNWKDRVLVLSDMPGSAYPALLILDRAPGGYMLWARPLRLFEWIKQNRILDGPMKDFYQYTYSKLHSDLCSKDLKLVLVHNYYCRDIMDKEKMMVLFLQNGYITFPDCISYSRGNWQPREFSGLNWSFNIFQRPDQNANK